MNIIESKNPETIDITIRLTDSAVKLMDIGAEIQGFLLDKSPSRAAWFRHLIDHSLAQYEPGERVTAADLRDNWPPAFFRQPLPHKVTIRITEYHRVLIRQHECFIQSLDWRREIYRNEACLQVIDQYGPFVNLALQIALERKQNAPSGASE